MNTKSEALIAILDWEAYSTVREIRKDENQVGLYNKGRNIGAYYMC